MNKLISLVFFVSIGTSAALANSYLNSQEVKELLNKIERASSQGSTAVEDEIQIEINEIQKKVNLANEKKMLENAEISLGVTEAGVNKRISSLQKYYNTVASTEEFIYSDKFSYQSFCKNGKDCKVSALVESEELSQKIEILREKIGEDRTEALISLRSVVPLEAKVELLRQLEQDAYSSSGIQSNSSMSHASIDTGKAKRYSEILDGDVFGNIKVKITKDHIKLSKNRR